MNPKSQDIRHYLISEVHRLLSVASAKDFVGASKLCTSESIRRALEALANEHLGERPSRKETRLSSRASRPDSAGGQQLALQDDDELLSQVMRSPRFVSRQGLLRFAQAHQLPLPVETKDSRRRLAKRLIKQIKAMPTDKRTRALDDLLSSNGRQTEGWVEVMKHGR